MGCNPCEFREGDHVISIYTGIPYKVGEVLRYGLRIMQNEITGVKETWNAYNNAHFVKENRIDLGILSLL